VPYIQIKNYKYASRKQRIARKKADPTQVLSYRSSDT